VHWFGLWTRSFGSELDSSNAPILWDNIGYTEVTSTTRPAIRGVFPGVSIPIIHVNPVTVQSGYASFNQSPCKGDGFPRSIAAARSVQRYGKIGDRHANLVAVNPIGCDCIRKKSQTRGQRNGYYGNPL